MDRKLIDETLINLLRMPEAARSKEVIMAGLTLAATAAGERLGSGHSLQLEQLKLSGALQLLANEMGEAYTHTSTLRLGPGREGVELFGCIEAKGATNGLPRFTAFGPTAERVLAKLRSEISQHGKAVEKQTRRPLRDSCPLRKLPKAVA